MAPPHHAGGLHLIASAEAAEAMPRGIGGRKWSVQTGAYGSKSQAHAAAGRALSGHAHATVVAQRQGHATLYHARLSGLTHEAAVHACRKMAHHGSCLVVSPSA
jgi:hypothetical protein